MAKYQVYSINAGKGWIEEDLIISTNDLQQAQEAARHEDYINKRDNNNNSTVEIRTYTNEYDYNLIGFLKRR